MHVVNLMNQYQHQQPALMMPKSRMKLMIIASRADFKTYFLKKRYEFGEPIPIPPNRVILVTIPDGVFRCNLNKGIFAEDRLFIQNEGLDFPHILRFKNLCNELDPTLTVKVHYSMANTNVTVEFL
jgi:hypothetical protein